MEGVSKKRRSWTKQQAPTWQPRQQPPQTRAHEQPAQPREREEPLTNAIPAASHYPQEDLRKTRPVRREAAPPRDWRDPPPRRDWRQVPPPRPSPPPTASARPRVSFTEASPPE